MMAGHYEPVEWERVSLDGRGRWVSKRPEPQRPVPKKHEHGDRIEILGSVDYIRKLICTNRDGILLLISVLLICDCDDSVEMLIALAVFLYPLLKS